MKTDPKTGGRYAHTPEEWVEVIKRQGAGMSVPASLAARLGPAIKQRAMRPQPTGLDSGSKKDE